MEQEIKKEEKLFDNIKIKESYEKLMESCKKYNINLPDYFFKRRL